MKSVPSRRNILSTIYSQHTTAVVGVLLGLLTFLFHYFHNPYMATLFASVSIALLSLTVSEVAEVLAEQGARVQDPTELTAAVRVALGRSIVQKLNGLEHEMPVITLDPSLEQMLMQSVQGGGQGGPGIEPGLADRMFKSLEEITRKQEMSGQPAILVVAPSLRLWLAQLVKHSVSGLSVLSYSEIPDNKNIKVVAAVGADGGS